MSKPTENVWSHIPEWRRELYLRIVDTAADVHPITTRLYFLDNHFPLHKLDKALQWLVSNGYVGSTFLKWVQTVCQNSNLEMHRVLLAVVDVHEVQAPIIAGKNFRT